MLCLRIRCAPSPSQLGYTRVGHPKLSKWDISDFDGRGLGRGVTVYRWAVTPHPDREGDPTSPDGRGGTEPAETASLPIPSRRFRGLRQRGEGLAFGGEALEQRRGFER